MAERKASRGASGRGKEADGREAWHRILRLSRRVLDELDARLDAEHRIGVNEFDVLITLDNAADRRLRMTDLAQAVMLSSGGLTRLVGRLEGRGLVQRIPDPRDARSFYATLTEDGSALLAAARVTHDRVIEALLGAKLSASEVRSLSRALGRALAA
ncbi:MAG: MarR family winged helix-turn-helix transcriptional regulator [Chloroflexota bacterium]